MRVGFIGLGQMGHRMAKNLIKNNHRLLVHDTNKDLCKEFEALGAEVAESPWQVASSAQTAIITMLPSSVEVKEVYFGKDGIFSWIGKEDTLQTPVLIDCSTTDVHTARQVYAASLEVQTKWIPETAHHMHALGIPIEEPNRPVVVDAPVSGGVLGAKAGTLTFMVGGEEVAISHVASLLGCMGSRVVHCGPHGSGQAAKLCNNLAMAVQMAGLSEALVLGQRLGLDPEHLSSIFNASSARSWSSDTYNPCPGVMEGVPASRNYEDGFKVSHMVKDLEQAEIAAHMKGMELPLCSETLSMYKQLVTEGWSEKDFSVIYQHTYGGKPRDECLRNLRKPPWELKSEDTKPVK